MGTIWVQSSATVPNFFGLDLVVGRVCDLTVRPMWDVFLKTLFIRNFFNESMRFIYLLLYIYIVLNVFYKILDYFVKKCYNYHKVFLNLGGILVDENKFFDNVNNIACDDMAAKITKGSSVSIAAAFFSMYAYNVLREQLENVEEF